LVVPLFEIRVLVLKSVRELVSQDRLLLFNVYPVEHVNGLGFGVVEGFDLLIEECEEKGLEGEVAIEQPEFLEHNFSALQALGAFVFVEFFLEVTFNGGAGGDLALDGALDGQAGLLGGEFEQFIDEGEELFGLFGGDVSRSFFRGLGGGLGRGGWLGWRRLLRRGCRCRREAQRKRP
jgi:hypothetical protein